MYAETIEADKLNSVHMKLTAQSGFFENRRNTKLFYHSSVCGTATCTDNKSSTGNKTSNSNKTAIIICPPLFDERVISQPLIHQIAQSLALEGHPVLQFDYRGTGDSFGQMENSTLADFSEDVVDAIHFFQNKTGDQRFSLLGLRLGANIALNLKYDATTTLKPEKIVGIDVIPDLSQYMNVCLRYNLATQLSVYNKVIRDRKKLIADMNQGISINMFGYQVGKPLYDSIVGTETLSIDKSIRTRTTLIQITNNLKKGLPKLILDMGATGVNCTQVKGSPLWHEPKYFDATQSELVFEVIKALK
ncbi:MAG: hypothetical protein KUG82_00700 [Pseudomonadales bacterium]|nr:hypothetical protein [Pseudomonadales bacterium]